MLINDRGLRITAFSIVSLRLWRVRSKGVYRSYGGGKRADVL
jgi:hypothetical protein